MRHRPSPRSSWAVSVSTPRIRPDFGGAGLGELLHGPAAEVEMHVSRFEQVVCDFHLVGDGADDVRADVAPVVECL